MMRRLRIRYKIGLGLLGSLLVLAILRSILRSLRIMFLSMGAEAICPECGSRKIHPSKTPEFADRGYRLFGLLAYRCDKCTGRFYRPKVVR